MSRDKKVLLLTHRVPYPPNRGDRIRSYHLLRYLAERYGVYLGALADEPVSEECLDVLRELTEERALVPLGARKRWALAACSLAQGRSASDGLFASRQLRSQVRAWARSADFHAVMAFCSSMVQFTSVPELVHVPLIVDLVDVDSQKWLDYAASGRAWKRWLFGLEAARVRRLESSLPERAVAITLVSEPEADIYRGFCPNDKTYVVPNGVDLAHFRPDFPVVASRPNQCVFVGVLDYRPNVEGLVWFCNEVWPRVLAQKRDALFAVVGKNPAPAVRKLASRPGVRLVGEVPDVQPFIAESRFSVAPLKIARGVQNKVLEAMAMRKPVLGTPQVFEGLAVENEIHILSANDPESFSADVKRLYTDDSLCHRLSRAGREYVEQHHCWQTCLEPLASVLNLPQPAGPYETTYALATVDKSGRRVEEILI